MDTEHSGLSERSAIAENTASGSQTMLTEARELISRSDFLSFALLYCLWTDSMLESTLRVVIYIRVSAGGALSVIKSERSRLSAVTSLLHAPLS